MALVVWSNSWVSVADALMISEERVDLAGFIAYVNTEEESLPEYSLVEASLIQAYHAIKRYRFLVPGFVVKPEPFLMTDLAPEEISLLPDDFVYALKLAQVLEASHLLGLGDSLEQYAASRRQAGIVEEQVGESRTKFANSSVGGLSGQPVSSKALSALSGYIYQSVKLVRA